VFLERIALASRANEHERQSRICGTPILTQVTCQTLLLLVGHPESFGINHGEGKNVLAALGDTATSFFDGRRRNPHIPVNEANLFHDILDDWLRGEQKNLCGM
jgi:hypothetical protein